MNAHETVRFPVEFAGGEAEAAVRNLLLLVDMQFTEKERHQSFVEHNISFILSPGNMIKVLADWKVSANIELLTRHNIEKIKLPAIAECDQQYFILSEVANGELHYLHLEKGWQKETLERFLQRKKGMVLSVTEALPFSREDRMEKHNRKSRAVADYKQSIKEIPHFLTTEECEELIHTAQPHFDLSKINDHKGQAIISEIRTSRSAFIPKETPIQQKVIQKAWRELAPLGIKSIESIQCLEYQENQEFKAHFDTQHFSEEDSIRNYTLIIYLNQDFEGGETYFPTFNHKIVPERGKAVLFPLLNNHGKVDRLSLHAGLPVSRGRKFMCNVWGRIPKPTK